MGLVVETWPADRSDRVFEPLGMVDTAFSVADVNREPAHPFVRRRRYLRLGWTGAELELGQRVEERLWPRCQRWASHDLENPGAAMVGQHDRPLGR